MKRKVRVYKPTAQQGMQQAPNPELVVGTVVNSLSSTMDENGNIIEEDLKKIRISLEQQYGKEFAEQVIQKALNQIEVDKPKKTSTEPAGPQAMIDPNYNPFAEQEAMNQQIMDEALTETPVDLVAKRGLQIYQDQGQTMGDFYDTYETRPEVGQPIVSYDPMRDNPSSTPLTTFVGNYGLSPQKDPLFSDDQINLMWARGMTSDAISDDYFIDPAPLTPEQEATLENINDPFNDQWAKTIPNKQVKGGSMTKKQYAKNIMNYMKQAGGMSDAEMVDNTDTLNGREQINSNFINTLNNQSQIGAVNEFAEDTYEDFARGGQQRRAMRQANRTMRRAGRAMRGMPMMPGFMPMPMTQFGPMNPFVNQFFPVNATASTNINPYGIRSIERYGRGLFRRPKTTVNFFNPYDFIDRGVVDAETVDTVTETPIDGNNASIDDKVQDQAKTNTEVKQVETHSQKKGKGADGKKAKKKAEELDQSNTVTNKDPRLAAMQEWKDLQAERYSKGLDLSTGESIYFQDLPLGPNQDKYSPYATAMGDLLSQESLAQKYPQLATVVTEYMSQDPRRVMPQGILARYPEYEIEDIEAMQKELFPNRYMQFGGFVSPELYEFVYGAEKKKAIDFELPEAQGKQNSQVTLSPQELELAKKYGINDPGFDPTGTRNQIKSNQRNEWIDQQMQRSNQNQGMGIDRTRGTYDINSSVMLDPQQEFNRNKIRRTNQGTLPYVYNQGQAYDPMGRYDKRTQAPNFVGSLMFGPAGAGLARKPIEYAGSWIKYKGSKGDYIGQPITSISEKEDLKGRGKKWEITRGADAPRRTRINKDQQMPQFMDMNAPMTDEQYIEMMQGDQPGRRRAADFFYKLGQKSGLNPEKNLFTKIGTKLEPDRDFSTVQTAPQSLQTRPAATIPTADADIIQKMDPTPGMEPLANAINIEAPDANQYIVSDPSRGEIDPSQAVESLNQTLDVNSSSIPTPEIDIADNIYTPDMDVSNLSGQTLSTINRNPMLPPITGVDPAQEFVQINEDYIPGYGPRDFGARPESIIDMTAIQQGQDYDRQSAYEDYIRRSMDAQDMTQRGLYGQDLLDQEFANRDDWFTVGIPQVKSNQARRARQRADIASESSSTKPVIRGEGVGDLGLKKTGTRIETGTGTDFSSAIPYDQYFQNYKDPTDYAVEAAMTDYSSIPDEEFWTDYAPTIQALASQERMESDPILKEALRRDIYNLHRERAIRSAALARTNRTNKDFRDEYLRALTPEQLKDFFAARQTGGALNQYQGSQASQVTSVQDGSAYPGALAIGDYESPMVAFMNQGDLEIPYDQPVQYETNEYMGGDGTPQEEITPILGPKYKEKYKRKDMYNIDFPAILDYVNVAGNAAASLFEKQGKNWENFSSDEMAQAQRSTDKLDYETLTGLFRPDEMGSDLTMQAKKGGAYEENQVTYLSEDQIKEIIDNGGEIEFV